MQPVCHRSDKEGLADLVRCTSWRANDNALRTFEFSVDVDITSQILKRGDDHLPCMLAIIDVEVLRSHAEGG